MANNITNYPNQFFYGSDAPLDATAQVETLADLTITGDNAKVLPYIGKLVHVKNEHKYYICSAVNESIDGYDIGVWTPIFAEDGTAFFLRGAEGNLYEITANEGRLEVTMTAPGGH